MKYRALQLPDIIQMIASGNLLLPHTFPLLVNYCTFYFGPYAFLSCMHAYILNLWSSCTVFQLEDATLLENWCAGFIETCQICVCNTRT